MHISIYLSLSIYIYIYMYIHIIHSTYRRHLGRATNYQHRQLYATNESYYLLLYYNNNNDNNNDNALCSFAMAIRIVGRPHTIAVPYHYYIFTDI